jgi:HD-GYP domain-containing protein (c-di-GMP phosphodiesterase class II)
MLWKTRALLEMQESNIIFEHTFIGYHNLYSIDELPCSTWLA